MRERLSLGPEQYVFDERFHHFMDANSGNLGDIQRLPAPYIVQREVHKQRAFVRLHYDFMYVLRILPNAAITVSAGYEPLRFVDIPTLREMTAQGKVFPDVLDAYQRILQIASEERL